MKGEEELPTRFRSRAHDTIFHVRRVLGHNTYEIEDVFRPTEPLPNQMVNRINAERLIPDPA